MLTDTEIRKAKPAEKPVRMFDGGGLYLEISPAGGKLWRLKYRIAGREKRLALGAYPDVSLAKARALTADARGKLADGIDPGAEKQARKESKKQAKTGGMTFSELATRWHFEHAPSKSSKTAGRWEYFLAHAREALGDLSIEDIRAADLVKMAKAISAHRKHETARRTFAIVSRILRYAVAHGLIERNPAADVSLVDFLPTVKARHHASVTDPKAVGALMRAIDGYEGSAVVRLALKLAALTFVRPGELRHAEWAEIDADAAEWRIPGHKMKMKDLHIVPLAPQALAVIEALRPLTGGGLYLFPSERTVKRPMSENTVNAALRRLGYSTEEHTGHGFRSTASTRLHELGYSHQVIERQLAHAERNKVAGAYNFAEYLPERRKMMQAWADHLDELATGAKVITLVA